MNPFWPPGFAGTAPAPNPFAAWAQAFGLPPSAFVAMPGMAGIAPGFMGPAAGMQMPGAGWGSPNIANLFAMPGADAFAAAQGWWAQMQQFATSLAGQQMDARQIAEKWRSALGGASNPAFAQVFRGVDASQVHGFSAWLERIQPMLQAWRQQVEPWLSMPAVGFAREHQTRLQDLLRALMQAQETQAAFNLQLTRTAEDAFTVFEELLRKHEAPGAQLTSARALFDVWIEAAEQAFARAALSEAFREKYAAMTNAQMRLRRAMNLEMEQAGALFDLPTRTELDSAHKRIAELERQVRRMQRAASKQSSPTPQAAEAQDAPAASDKAGGDAKTKAAKPTAKPQSGPRA